MEMDSGEKDLLTHGVGFPDLRLSLFRCTIHRNFSLTFLPNGPAKSWDLYAYGKPTRRGSSLWSFILRVGRMGEKMNTEAFRLLWEERNEERGRERENEGERRKGRIFIGVGPRPNSHVFGQTSRTSRTWPTASPKLADRGLFDVFLLTVLIIA